MKNLQVFKFSKKCHAFFKHSLKFYRIFGENLDKNLEKLKYAFAGGSGGRDPDASEFMEI